MADLGTKEAAEYLGYSPHTLRKARMEGEKLASVEGPAFRMQGTRAKYKVEDLDEWLAQFDLVEEDE